MRNPFYISIQKTGESETIEKLRTNLWDEENRLRAVDITPDAEGIRPIAVYTYDAGGERILKHSNTSVSIYLNGKKVADTIQVDATLYPSGMLVARLGNNGNEEEQTLAYTKHYYAGTQRVSSKIGTTENLGDYLYDWFTGGMGGPVDVIGSSLGVLENAEDGVVQVYDELGIDSPTYESNPVFIPVQSFVHGGNEVEQYYFHPDHLGSTSYITNLLGEVSQHMEYFAFGETFVEEHRSSNNSPYKYNGKELDEETGWYYYGARYYDPRVSVWLSVDPLAEQTMTPYQYTYQNPLRYIDPIGMSGEDIIIENTKTKTITRVKDGSEDDTWVKDGVTIEKGLSKSQTEGRIAMATYDDSEWKSNEVSIVFSDSKSVYRETVSDYSISVIVDVMNETGENSIQVNSTMRTPEDQARIMYDLVKTGGMAEQKKLYGVNGRAVLDKYPNQQAMVDKINEIGPSKVSNHLGDTSKINVVDISRYVGLKRPRNFAEKLQADKRVQKVLSPWNSKDRAIHTEIPQPK